MPSFIKKVTYYKDAFTLKIAPTPLDFLRQLKGLSIFDVQGKESNRTRVITTLIHGNEPSGFIALHHWLLEKKIPEVNIRFILCNPEAAALPPEFSHRYLVAAQDLNRFFTLNNSSPTKNNSSIIHRAEQIIKAVTEVNPEAIVDLHNTSGISPAFGVAIDDSDKVLDLISLFTNKVILTDLHVGAIMEQKFSAPIVTIECGGACQMPSHQLAITGLEKFTNQKSIFDHHADKVDIHRHPCRVELKKGTVLGFGDYPLMTADITLLSDAEELNNQVTPAGQLIGWYEKDTQLPLIVKDEKGNNQLSAMFYLKYGGIYTNQRLQIFMATKLVDIATNDCLFYATLE
ncbi:MAG: succinylglutamate desuccinylase/aspartoacylase family protein [Colwellia sp.]|nr:succinylglutamate desuccinylase/aspartoacylase family protein [Colwellia sp.]